VPDCALFSLVTDSSIAFIVFTLPPALRDVPAVARWKVYDAMLRASSTTLARFAHENLHGEPGVVSVLHTWGQTCPTTRTSTASSLAAPGTPNARRSSRRQIRDVCFRCEQCRRYFAAKCSPTSANMGSPASTTIC
jgi:hypothetical protein